jgi:hypothetical protein
MERADHHRHGNKSGCDWRKLHLTLDTDSFKMITPVMPRKSSDCSPDR